MRTERDRQQAHSAARRRWNVCALAVVGSTVAMSPSVAHGQCQYDVTVLEYPIGCAFGTVRTVGLGWNQHGWIVGYYQCPIWKHTEAFLWTPDEGFETLPRPAGITSSRAVDINDNGTIVGIFTGTGFQFRGYVYEDGEYTELEPLPGGAWSQAIAINDAGQVTGYRSIGSKDDPVFPYNAFVWSWEEGFIDLGVMSGPASSGSAINDAGVVVGWTGNSSGSISDTFVWEDGSLSFLGPIPGGFTSRPFAITNNGIIVGSGRLPEKGSSTGKTHAFLWEDSEYRLLGTLPEHLRSAAVAANEVSQVVGPSWTVDGNPNISHAFIWQHGAMADFNLLVSHETGIEITTAFEVANDGKILAFGDEWTLILAPLNLPLGDIDLDCRVGIHDFLLLLAEWGACPKTSDCPADLNGDAVVDGLDFAIVLMNWG